MQSWRILQVLLLKVLIGLGEIASQKFSRDGDLQSYTHVTPLWSRNCRSKLNCATMCKQDNSCVSFLHDSQSNSCIGSSRRHIGPPADGITDRNWSLYTSEFYSCPNGYFLYKKKFCYRYEFRNCTDWFSANNQCQTEGGTLLRVYESTDFDYFRILAYYNEVPGGCTDLWYGANDIAAEGTFVFVTGEVMIINKPPWDLSQPDAHYLSQDCVEMRAGSFYKLADSECSESHGFVCQIDFN
ncbi:hypothetical protein CHS0354_003934 [Potamilus streckersoni]|uniref:C-type lectin domain-containing protein n=1 Tax=Potamilus streckersoni TaxID=2493646 RepID=A0AAE0S3B6_9BIVA|nr:hypothetical protein CHS0354_003934 [Potamilus streckersoni]